MPSALPPSPAAPEPSPAVPPADGDERRAAVPWGVADAVAVFAGQVVLTVLLLAAPPGARSPLQQLVGDRAAEALRLPAAAALLGVVLFAWVGARHRGSVRLLWGARRATPADVGIGIAAGLAAFVVCNLGLSLLLQALAGEALPTVQPELRQDARDPRTAPALAVTAILIAPLAEELFFRGLLFQGLHRRLATWPAAGLSGLPFALAHAEATLEATALVFLSLFPFGLWLAWLVARRGTVVTAIAAHAAFNAVGVAALLSGLGG